MSKINLGKLSNKYDRQLRLWKEHGQESLENSKILLLNATAAGTEALKNLVLPGIASYTIVDNKIPSKQDISNNFFLPRDNREGYSRSCLISENLKELNSSVDGCHLEEDPVSLIEGINNNFILQFSLVIASSLPESSLLKLSDLCSSKDIPLVICNSYGFIGYLRLVLPEHCVVETHEENKLDLRLDCPFPTLQKYVDDYEIDVNDSETLAHIPYIVLLIKIMKTKWLNENSTTPSNSEEISEFKKRLRNSFSGLDSENIDEALHNVFRICTKTSIPQRTQQLFEHPKCINLSSSSSPFWITLSCIKEFSIKQNGVLPLPGNIPDMKAKSNNYVELLKIYKEKALEDVNSVRILVDKTLSDFGLQSDYVSTELISKMCRYCSNIRVLSYSSLESEYTNSNKMKSFSGYVEDRGFHWYIVLRACFKFFDDYKRYPGSLDTDWELDIPALRKIVNSMIQPLGLSHSVIPDELVHEM
jgi:amyloid beta precursor protein binding protein 1